MHHGFLLTMTNTVLELYVNFVFGVLNYIIHNMNFVKSNLNSVIKLNFVISNL